MKAFKWASFWRIVKGGLHPGRIPLGMIVLLIGLSLLAFQQPDPLRFASASGLAPLQTVQPATQQPTLTPTISPEIEGNRSQTNGIVVGAIFLVLIIVVGTLISERALRDP
jgi:hypothetical protein